MTTIFQFVLVSQANQTQKKKKTNILLLNFFVFYILSSLHIIKKRQNHILKDHILKLQTKISRVETRVYFMKWLRCTKKKKRNHTKEIRNTLSAYCFEINLEMIEKWIEQEAFFFFGYVFGISLSQQWTPEKPLVQFNLGCSSRHFIVQIAKNYM